MARKMSNFSKKPSLSKSPTVVRKSTRNLPPPAAQPPAPQRKQSQTSLQPPPTRTWASTNLFINPTRTLLSINPIWNHRELKILQPCPSTSLVPIPECLQGLKPEKCRLSL